MKWDVKIALSLFLGYALYGISYLFSDGHFLVPLPMLFILIPIVSLVFLLSSGLNKYTLFFVLLPMGVLSDKVGEFSYIARDIFVIASMVAWIVLALVLFFDNSFKANVKKQKVLIIIPLLYLLSFLLLFNDFYLTTGVFLLLGITTGIAVREDGEGYTLKLQIRRLFILTAFISWMYLITMLSVYLA